MLPIIPATKPATLDPWGTVADLGSEILDGDVKAFGRIVYGAPDGPVSCGWFSCTQGRFRMVYPFTEHATVIEGEVTLTDEKTGISHHYGVGDSWFIEKGTPILWHVQSPVFTKNYFAVA
ncbi:MAG: cupin domain-containing protein [Niveispirillum sp.]|uniref:cupin domain-containing protein n=1 Tax=Niveispirillum sp. TaxID=1917217 RepID=UPI003BA75F25